MEKDKLFNIGVTSKTDKRNKRVNKKLTFEDEKLEKKKVVSFSKKGNLSPHKKQQTTITKNVSFEKKAPLSPKKLKTNNVSKISPEKIKLKLGIVNKLSDLKERFKEIESFKVPPSVSPIKPVTKPKLSNDNFSLEVSLPPSPRKHLFKSPVKDKSGQVIKASPSKLKDNESLQSLPLPTEDLPLPPDYALLSKFFSTLDNLICLKTKSQEFLSLIELKPMLETATKKTFREKRLRQVNCVFPKAYHYEWKKIAKEQILHLKPNINYEEKSMESTDRKLNLKDLMTRKSIFQVRKFGHKDFSLHRVQLRNN